MDAVLPRGLKVWSWGCVKSPRLFIWRLTQPNVIFERTTFCLILLCKMRQNVVLYFAAVGGGTLFTQPHTFHTTPKSKGASSERF